MCGSRCHSIVRMHAKIRIWRAQIRIPNIPNRELIVMHCQAAHAWCCDLAMLKLQGRRYAGGALTRASRMMWCVGGGMGWHWVPLLIEWGRVADR